MQGTRRRKRQPQRQPGRSGFHDGSLHHSNKSFGHDRPCMLQCNRRANSVFSACVRGVSGCMHSAVGGPNQRHTRQSVLHMRQLGALCWSRYAPKLGASRRFCAVWCAAAPAAARFWCHRPKWVHGWPAFCKLSVRRADATARVDLWSYGATRHGIDSSRSACECGLREQI